MMATVRTISYDGLPSAQRAMDGNRGRLFIADQKLQFQPDTKDAKWSRSLHRQAACRTGHVLKSKGMDLLDAT